MTRKRSKKTIGECKLFTHFKPKPGGQTDFFNLVPLNSIEPIPYKAIWMRGGIGGGKSFIGSAFVCSRAFLDPQARGLITANTYSQLETSTLIALSEFCEMFNIPIEPKRATHEETAKAIAMRRLVKIFNASILVISAEAFMGETANSRESGRGLQIRYFWFDEGAYSTQSAFDTLIGRLGRGPGKMKGLGILTSSINRNNPYNFAYSYFDDPERSEGKKSLYKSLNLLTVDNDSLDPDYVLGLEATYTPELAAIELRGEYAITSEGRAFPYFDRTKHVKPISYDPKLPVHVSLDFNRHPATGTLSQVDGLVVKVFHEFYLLNADTFKLGKALATRLGELGVKHVHLHGDATGNNKTANSNQSNWAIIHDALDARKIKHTIEYGQSNPPVRDTINSLNSLLHHDRFLVDVSCKETIKDLEFVKFDKKGDLDKKADLMRTHCGDTCRYLAHDLFPYIRKIVASTAVVGKPLAQLTKR